MFVRGSTAGNLNMTQSFCGGHLWRYSTWGYCPGLPALEFWMSLKYSIITFHPNQNIFITKCVFLDLHQFYTIIFSYLAGLVVEPDQCMIPGQHLAVEGGVVLGWATSSHWPADLNWLIQVHMSLLEWVWVGSAGEHSQRWRHWFWLESITPTRYEGQVFLIQSGRLLLQSPKNNLQYLWPTCRQNC